MELIEKDEITDALTTAAKNANAFNAEAVVRVVRDKAVMLPNGEIVLRDVMPAALQSPA